MPVVQHESDLFETTETQRFLNHCQQQAIQSNSPKIASLTFAIAPIAPWAVLAVLGDRDQRHFYYDPPQQPSMIAPSMIAIDAVVGCSAAGSMRFAQAQAFVRFWQGRFIYAQSEAAQLEIQPNISSQQRDLSPLSARIKSYFSCSATFFDHAALSEAAHFEPIYVSVPGVQVLTSSETSTATFNALMTASTDIDQITERIYWQLQRLMRADSLTQAKVATRQVISKDVANFEGAVGAALRQVKAGHLHKVVLADVMDIVTPQPVDEVRSLQTLRTNHPDCTVFSVGNGRGQSFIGASPERLLSISQGQLTTDALAGSAPRGTTAQLDADIAQTLLHSKKERYEHQVVVEFIARQLRSLGLNPRYANAPQLLQLLHIQHLHTPIKALLSPQTVPPLDILAKLHPTPAVAGVPRQAACQLISQHETFDRSLYAAPLGWIDTQGNSEFIVGIRSALIDGCKARLYAGAGIVAGSEPSKELAEIKLKLQTLLNALV
jgi:menaquinone-specific isochorismate synthase